MSSQVSRKDELLLNSGLQFLTKMLKKNQFQKDFFDRFTLRISLSTLKHAN